jgi:hypothetical protein
MALFSDVDWVIIVAAAAFLLFGKGNTEVLRTMGRWYSRAGRIKQELLSEFTKAADPPSPSGGALTLRGALLGLDPPVTHRSGIPAAVTSAPTPPFPPAPTVPLPPEWTSTYPTATWSMTVPSVADPPEVAR